MFVKPSGPPHISDGSVCVCLTDSGSLRVSDVVDLFLTRHLQDVVYNSREILQSQLIIAAAETGGQTGTLM